MTGPVYIARISYGRDWIEWMHADCAAELRKRGWEIKLGDIVGFDCDRCKS